MARHKNQNWTLHDQLKSWDEVQTAILMDIRDELRALREYQQSWQERKHKEAVVRIDKRLLNSGFLLNKKRSK